MKTKTNKRKTQIIHRSRVWGFFEGKIKDNCKYFFVIERGRNAEGVNKIIGGKQKKY